MAKKYFWEIEEPETDAESGELTGNTVKHSIELTCSYLSGKAIITINGIEFNISEKPFSLKGTSQMFRLGDMPATISFEKKGAPTVTVDGNRIEGTKKNKKRSHAISMLFLTEKV